MKGLEEIIKSNDATYHTSEFMRKFVLEFPEWVTKEYLVVRTQGYLTTESLTMDSTDKKFLITINIEEV